ncbi:tetraacyldisaccharide 4'-kinase [Marinobacter confluentis]|uniref:Tetraacyldisaccharide 4'-kinase n=1 Tax=Marinobacter confluentis TaxID=1697557 RepID=A0A4Z1BVL6_9GAMM|nr:tetraacyldisaccharide 4'-kinase [Marinobacter confluentis]TGN41449.1 tetraacyldisaccharide 4'-kinase [Marinobacter confluentis]
MRSRVDRLWYGKGRPLWPLYPLAWLYRFIAEHRRRAAWQAKDSPISVPVVVVGNITAGGTGKSPLTAMLARLLKQEGWCPVILTRGYGGKSDHYPLQVLPDTAAAVAGDEPVMLAAQAKCPVVVDPDRRQGALWALDQGLGNIMLCDDGLQHYRLPRDIELAVFDGQRGLGNGAPIPVGPLRELPERLESVDFVITNGGWLEEIEHSQQYTMTLVPTCIRHLATGRTLPLADIRGKSVMAVAGIGNPGRFFDTLRSLGARLSERALPDHHRFTAQDLRCEHPDQWLVMTAKDAVKCRDLAPDNAWVLEVEAQLPDAFALAFMSAVEAAGRSMAAAPSTDKEK